MTLYILFGMLASVCILAGLLVWAVAIDAGQPHSSKTDDPASYPVWQLPTNPDYSPADLIKQCSTSLTDSALRPPVLRKLHLVRPDLIPYPLFIETYA